MTKRKEARARAVKAAQRKGRIQSALWALGIGSLVIALYMIQRPWEHAPRVAGEGRSDASHIMHPAAMYGPRAATAYGKAREIPAVLNHLYCWCGCTEYHGHRSALACFEDEHGAQCDVCMRTAEIAWDMVQHGVTDPATIQQELDAKVRPRGL